MTVRLGERGTRALVLDIEGTTTSIAFVYEVLFPFARDHLRAYLRDHLDSPDVRDSILRLRAEWTDDVASGDGPPAWPDRDAAHDVASIAAYVEWLMDWDRKSPALKRLQGQIWQEGYASGALVGEVFDDVPGALKRWREAGIDIAIYSSGSVLAQKLLFRHTAHGDLTPFISKFFDTAVGAKTSADSYARIAADLQQPVEHVMFVSDAAQELAAARAAGWQVVMAIRPGNRIQSVTGEIVVRSFDELI